MIRLIDTYKRDMFSQAKSCLSGNVFFIFSNLPKTLIILCCMLMSVGTAKAQFDTSNMNQAATLSDGILNKLPSGSLGANDYKEYVAASSTINFSVPLVVTGAGDITQNIVEWYVEGGRIIGDTKNGQYTNLGYNVNTSYKKVNPASGDTESTINITWDSNDYDYAYILVKQTSEYGCSDDRWSIYYINIETSDKYVMELVDITNVCAGQDITVRAKIKKEGASYDFTLTESGTGRNVTVASTSLTAFDADYYKYEWTISTSASTVGINPYVVGLSNFKVKMINGGNEINGTITTGKESLSGIVYPLPPTRIIEHN